MPVLKGGAKMFDGDLNRKLGINSTAKYINENSAVIYGSSIEKDSLKRLLQIIDEQDATNRYKWYNIPCDLTSQEIERLLYFKGSLCFFYMESTEKFYFMPYALEGGIDFYARYNQIHPLPMSCGVDPSVPYEQLSGEEKKLKRAYSAQESVLSKLKLDVIKEVMFDEDVTYDTLTKSAVILRDYTNQLSQVNIARSILNSEVINMMSDYFPFLGTNLLMGTGIEAFRVNNSAEKDEVKAMAQAVYNAALAKNPYVASTSNIEFQNLTGGTRNRAEDYLMAFQSLDNFRLSTYGIANGGVFEKKAHVLESENAVNYSTVMSAYQDGIKLRQAFCNIVNSIWGLDMWCEPAESVLGQDMDGDGLAIDEELPEEPNADGGMEVEGE